MYGGSSKHGRIGGRGAKANKLGRASIPRPHRSSAPASNRLSMGSRGGRNAAPATSSAVAVEEKFSLVAGNSAPAFSMIIRLAPGMIEEISRAEAQGGTPRIKFGSNPTNSGANVIDVCGKEFNFIWSPEVGSICDVYEERETGEDGNGLLVESGRAWRKLSVGRVLDESTSSHVKMRSEQAEREHKSRQTVVLEQNPAMKNQLKQFAAGPGSNSWRSFKQKKEPPSKKQKVEPPRGPQKSAYKPGISSTTAKRRQSSSPLLSPPEQSASPFGMLKTAEETITSQVKDKEVSNRTAKEGGETVGKGNSRAKPTDMRSLLITLLLENPKGMNLMALRKAIGDSSPNSLKKIELILEKIATRQASGMYLLKPGVELQNSKKPMFESRSSPEENLHHTSVADGDYDEGPAQVAQFEEKVSFNAMEEQGHEQSNATVGEDPNAIPTIEDQQHSPDLFGEKKTSDNTEARVGSSSESGGDSDSESDSSDTGSDRSRSKSPIGSGSGSGSGSSSDSESDVSSNSKEDTDEEVNIMSDDEEPKQQIQASQPEFAALNPDSIPVQSGNDDKQGEVESDAVDIENCSPEAEHDAVLAVVSSSEPNICEQPVKETKAGSPEHTEHHERQSLVDSLFGKTTDKDDYRYEQSDSSERKSKGKSKRSSEVMHSDETSVHTKRSKTENSLLVPAALGKGVHFPDDPHNLSPNRVIEGSYKGPVSQILNEVDRDGNTEFDSQKGYTQAFSGKYSSESKQSSRKSYDHSAQAKAPDQADRPDRYAESLGHGRQYSEKSSHVQEGFPVRKDNIHSKNKDGYAPEKKFLRNLKESSGRGKQSLPLDSHYQKHGDVPGKIKEDGRVSSLFFSSSPKDNNRSGADRSPVFNGRSSKLRREVSDLELGELREPMPEETAIKKQLERKGSFKQSENQLNTQENGFPDVSKAKPAGKATLEFGKPSSPDLNSKLPSNPEGLNKKRNFEDRVGDLTGSQKRSLQPQSQHLSRVDHPYVGRQLSRSADFNSKPAHNEIGSRQGIGLDGHGESNKKAAPSATQHHDSKRGPVSNTVKEIRRPASNMMEHMDIMLAEGNAERKRRDSSSDENNCSYTKYEKDEPEFKGPIKNFSQYKEYVQEYRDKFESYCSLNKILESYRNEFLKLGKDLEFATGTDRYFNILEQLKESYRQSGTRHKRLKKIFVVLHEELKNLKQTIKDFALPYMKD